jgi:hypothetical protein
LQIVCTKLFEDARGARTINLSAYERLGRASNILGNYLRSMLASFPKQSGTIAKAILKELVGPEGTKRVRAYTLLASRVDATVTNLDETLTRLVNTRLIRRDEIEGNIVYEMAHEYLIAEIQQWLDASDWAFKQIEKLLTDEVAHWRIHGTLIPHDRLKLIYAQCECLDSTDETTGECLLRSALQADFEVDAWLKFLGCTHINLFLTLLKKCLCMANV